MMLQTKTSSASRSVREFPPYEILERMAEHTVGEPGFDAAVERAHSKTRKLERLYHQTQAHAWNPNTVLDELTARHGEIRLTDEQRAAIGHLFAVLLWGELAAWNISADLARELPDVEAKMAATGQVFDEARHFVVLREYLRRAKIDLPPLNPYGRRLLTRILGTKSLLEKLYGMQLLVENLALAIFRRVAESRIEPVLTDLLAYIERDESRHVALGVLHLPSLAAKASRAERLRNWAFNMELFALAIAGGQLLDPHLKTLGVDHRELGWTSMRLHQQVLREMSAEQGLKPGERLKGVYALASWQQKVVVDFLHPEKPDAERSESHRTALRWFDAGVRKLAARLS